MFPSPVHLGRFFSIPSGILCKDVRFFPLGQPWTVKVCVFKREGVSYGSFMRMKTLAMKKLRRTLMPPMKSSRKRLSLGMLGALERSRMMKPRPPMVKRKLEASPSMMYWPLTLENTSAEFRGWSQWSNHHRQGRSSEVLRSNRSCSALFTVLDIYL